MYKLCYYPHKGSTSVAFKDFETMDEAFAFLFKMPSGTLIELKLYPDTDTKKPDRN